MKRGCVKPLPSPGKSHAGRDVPERRDYVPRRGQNHRLRRLPTGRQRFDRAGLRSLVEVTYQFLEFWSAYRREGYERKSRRVYLSLRNQYRGDY